MALPETLRDRIRRGVDLTALVGGGIATLAQVGEHAFTDSARPWSAIVPTLGFALLGACALFRRVRSTPHAYIVVVMCANVLYLTSFGPWFGMGAVYIATMALALVFLPRGWWMPVGAMLAGAPLLLGLLHAGGVVHVPPMMDVDATHTWRRASIATLTSLGAAAVIVHYTIHHLVTARRALEQRVVLAREQRQERARLDAELANARRADLIAQLAASVGADIGGALQIVEARARALASELQSGDAAECLQDIQESTSSAAGMMRSLTAFAPEPEGAAPRGNASDAVLALPKLVRRTFPSKIKLSVAAAPDVWVGIGTTELARICTNLVVNARDAIADAGEIHVRLAREGEQALIEVRDSGSGMDEATLMRLFVPFFTTKPVGRGTGLGLATTKILVERAGGTITVASTVGRGTTFSIRVPLVPTPPG